MIDYIAAVFTIFGTWLQSEGKVRSLTYSFIALFIGNLFWGWFGLANKIWGLVLTSIAFGFLNTRAFLIWRKKK